MSVAKTVENFLQQHGVPYTVVEHPRSLSSKETADAAHLSPHDVVLGDDEGRVMMAVTGLWPSGDDFVRLLGQAQFSRFGH